MDFIGTQRAERLLLQRLTGKPMNTSNPFPITVSLFQLPWQSISWVNTTRD